MKKSSDVMFLLTMANELLTTLTSLEKQPPPLTPEETSSLFFIIHPTNVTRGISKMGFVCDDAISSVKMQASGPGDQPRPSWST
jgi:hypothetical protein